ncbi:MAG: ypdP [Chlamydiales bacterium]|nr:ypdP [Chlamydiales bacterium]
MNPALPKNGKLQAFTSDPKTGVCAQCGKATLAQNRSDCHQAAFIERGMKRTFQEGGDLAKLLDYAFLKSSRVLMSHHANRPLDGVALFLAAFFSVDIVLSNILSVKLFQFPLLPSMALPCGIITYPFSFLISDLINEIYGAQRARQMVYSGFIIGLMACLLIRLALELPAHPAWVFIDAAGSKLPAKDYQQMFEAIFGTNFLLFAGSLTAYMASQTADIWLYRKIKELTEGRFLWAQSAISTLLAQILDTAIVNTCILYFGLKLTWSIVCQTILLALFYKLFFILAGIPLFYYVISFYRQPKRLRFC